MNLWSGQDQSDGVQHGGGGSVGDSTPEQVNQAIDLAIQIANQPDPARNIFANFLWDSLNSENGFYEKNGIRIFPNLNKQAARTATFDSWYISPALQAFKTNQIVRLPKGDCPHTRDETTADASVSELNLTAKICFSVGNLTEIPPANILREVLGLVLHEACHLSGCDETEAKHWQADFTAYFARRLGDITVDDFTHPTRTNLSAAQQFLTMAKSVTQANRASPFVYASMGSVLAQLMSSPYTNDPIAIEIKAKPKHPEFIGNYWVLVNTVIQKIQVAFQPANPAFVFQLVDDAYPYQLADASNMLQKIAEIDIGLGCLRNNIAALTTGTLKSECLVKPMDNLMRFLFVPHYNGDPINSSIDDSKN